MEVAETSNCPRGESNIRTTQLFGKRFFKRIQAARVPYIQ